MNITSCAAPPHVKARSNSTAPCRALHNSSSVVHRLHSYTSGTSSCNFNTDDQQLPGDRLPGMLLLRQQMQQPHLQLLQQQQQQQRQGTALPQYSVQAVAQQSSQQQQFGQQQLQPQRPPVLLPKPADPGRTSHAAADTSSSSSSSSSSSNGSQSDSSSSRFAELRQTISAATSLQQLLQLLPAAAAADQPDITSRLMLQAVNVLRCSATAALDNTNSSSSGRMLWQLDGDDVTWSAAAAEATGSGARCTDPQQQEQLQQLLKACDGLLYRQVDRLGFQHASGVLWVWAQVRWKPAPMVVQQQQQQQEQQQQGEDSGGRLQLQQQQQSLWRLVIRQLVQSEVQHEMKGAARLRSS
jgi:hypothetical protein